MTYEVPPARHRVAEEGRQHQVLEGLRGPRGLSRLRPGGATNCLESNVKGKNPFKNPKVREVMHRSIDVDAIKAAP